MATCKECLHFEPCRDYGNILDPIHGGMICDSFKPIADVVPVVRCKNCTEWDEKEQECSHWYGFRENDFCSHGKEKEDGNL